MIIPHNIAQDCYLHCTALPDLLDDRVGGEEVRNLLLPVENRENWDSIVPVKGVNIMFVMKARLSIYQSSIGR